MFLNQEWSLPRSSDGHKLSNIYCSAAHCTFEISFHHFIPLLCPSSLLHPERLDSLFYISLVKYTATAQCKCCQLGENKVSWAVCASLCYCLSCHSKALAFRLMVIHLFYTFLYWTHFSMEIWICLYCTCTQCTCIWASKLIILAFLLIIFCHKTLFLFNHGSNPRTNKYEIQFESTSNVSNFTHGLWKVNTLCLTVHIHATSTVWCWHKNIDRQSNGHYSVQRTNQTMFPADWLSEELHL